MNVTDYDKMTDDYNDSLSININCTIKENKNDKIKPALLITKSCGLSILCLISVVEVGVDQTGGGRPYVLR